MLQLVIGTNRPGSNSAKVAAQVKEIYATLGAEMGVIDLAALPEDIFSPSSYAEKPAAFAPFADAVVNATGIVWVTPEYNGGVPGVAKYFIDMLPFPESLVGVPATFIGVSAGQWGALRPIEQLEAIFKYRQGLIYPRRVHLMPIGDLLDEDGRIQDEKMAGRLKKQAEGFIKFVGQVKGS